LDKIEPFNIDAYIPDDTYQSRSRGKEVSSFDKDNFIYDESTDVFTCPEGKLKKISKYVYKKGIGLIPRLVEA
jgi:hypothetical protein